MRHAESLGYDSAWTAEAYGNDAVSTAAWVLANTTKLRCGTAIMQMPARTPAMAAMTAMTLDHLSGGRFILGLGPSGPQVVEGWHGVPYGKPLTRTREYISIIRQILAREKPVEFHGEHYDIPVTGPGTTGHGKPLKSILHGNPNLPDLHRVDQPGRHALRGRGRRRRVPDDGRPGEVRLDVPALPEGGLREGGRRQEPRELRRGARWSA